MIAGYMVSFAGIYQECGTSAFNPTICIKYVSYYVFFIIKPGNDISGKNWMGRLFLIFNTHTF
jgi:hypothetical protein